MVQSLMGSSVMGPGMRVAVKGLVFGAVMAMADGVARCVTLLRFVYVT